MFRYSRKEVVVALKLSTNCAIFPNFFCACKKLTDFLQCIYVHFEHQLSACCQVSYWAAGSQAVSYWAAVSVLGGQLPKLLCPRRLLLRYCVPGVQLLSCSVLGGQLPRCCVLGRWSATELPSPRRSATELLCPRRLLLRYCIPDGQLPSCNVLGGQLPRCCVLGSQLLRYCVPGGQLQICFVTVDSYWAAMSSWSDGKGRVLVNRYRTLVVQSVYKDTRTSVRALEST